MIMWMGKLDLFGNLKMEQFDLSMLMMMMNTN